MQGRKLRRFRVNLRILSQVLRNRWTVKGAPDDFVIVAVHWEPGDPDVIEIVASSDTYPEVPPGSRIPLDAMWIEREG